MPLRSGSVVFADTSWRRSLKDGLATALELARPKALGEGAGGFMGTRLYSLKYGSKGGPIVKWWRGEAPVVVFDTGSEGCFVVDDTGDQADRSVLSPFDMTLQSEVCEITVGDAQKNFTITSPPQWRSFQGVGDAIARQPFRPERSGGRTQALIIGNAFMQSLSVTFSLSIEPSLQRPGNGSAMHLVLSHLDGAGARARAFTGPRALASKRAPLPHRDAHEQHEHLKRNKHRGPHAWSHKGWSGSTTAASFSAFSEGPSNARSLTDVEIPLHFLRLHPGGALKPQASETRDASELSEPAIAVSFRDPDGRLRTALQVADTGSGANIIVADGFETEELPCVKAKSCVGAGKVSDIFRQSVPNTAGLPPSRYPTRQDCRIDSSGVSQDASCDGCCQTCCLASGLTPETVLHGAKVYCTGALGFTPGEATISLEHSALANMSGVFAAKGFAACEPAPGTGILGMWFWMAPQKTDGKADESATTLPFHVLRWLRQLEGPNNNVTFKFWRSDGETPSAPSAPSDSEVRSGVETASTDPAEKQGDRGDVRLPRVDISQPRPCGGSSSVSMSPIIINVNSGNAPREKSNAAETPSNLLEEHPWGSFMRGRDERVWALLGICCLLLLILLIKI